MIFEIGRVALGAAAVLYSGDDGLSARRCARTGSLHRRVGAYAGKLLADLGADVVMIEPPDGIALRGHGLFDYLAGDRHPAAAFAAVGSIDLA